MCGRIDTSGEAGFGRTEMVSGRWQSMAIGPPSGAEVWLFHLRRADGNKFEGLKTTISLRRGAYVADEYQDDAKNYITIFPAPRGCYALERRGALQAVPAPLTPRPRGTIYEDLPFILNRV